MLRKVGGNGRGRAGWRAGINVGIASKLTLFFLVFGIAFFFQGCRREKGELRARYKEYNLLLVSIDTLRADHLGCYGYTRKTTYIDSIADRGFVFESMFTTSSTTFPAHVSLFTGSYPRDCRNGYYLNDSVTTLAEILGGNGYTCWAVVGALPLDVRFNLDQGFAFYDSDFSSCQGSLRLEGNRWFGHEYQVFDCNASEVTQRVITSVQLKSLTSPYFLWVHYYDPHFPYSPPGAYYDPSKVARSSFPFYYAPTPEDLKSLNELYDGEIQFVDDQLRCLIKGLEQRGKMDKTIVIIVSDHGENLYEHDNYLDHSQVVYDTVMHVPCIMLLPGQEGRRVQELASLIDIMPTILDLVGIEYGEADGFSLTTLMEGKTAGFHREYVTCQTNDFGVKADEQTIAIRAREVKYIENIWNQKEGVWFDLIRDPAERKPLKYIPGGVSSNLRIFFDSWLIRYSSGTLSSPGELSDEMKSALRRLGYLQ